MSDKYRLLDHIPWQFLHGQRIKLEVSENYILAVMSDGSFHVLAQGEEAKRLVCPVCGSPEHSAISTLPFWGCIRYLQGELVALRLRLATQPGPVPPSQGSAAIADAAQWGPIPPGREDC